MSLFAGIYSLDKQVRVTEKCKNIIRKTISRNDDVVETYSDKRIFLAKVDTGAYQSPAFLRESHNAVALLAGDPILDPPSNQKRSRISVLRELSQKLISGNISILKSCQGTFTLCWYDPSSIDLLLATDKVGVRPLYYYKDQKFIYFSSSLRVLEALDEVPKRMDLIGITEDLILGSSLGRRTPYADIQVLRGGEYLKIEGSNVKVSHYFRWDDVSTSKADLNELLDRAYKTFICAVESRGWRDSAAISFLSGGMDSRCVVTALRILEKQISTGNFSPPGSQDLAYAEQYAKILGLNHKSILCSKGEQKTFMFTITNMMSKLISDVKLNTKYRPKYPQLVFSGDGGSVGLGHVYMNDRIVDLMRRGSIDATVANYMRNKILPRHLLRKDIYSQLTSALYDSVRTELTSIMADDPGRNFYIFLMDNNQRRHLRDHFENIDEHRLEFHLPFYDGNFLESIVSTPVDACLRHEFYTKWLNCFPDEIKSVPWQTYPGHVPCPIKKDENLSYQWSPNIKDRPNRSGVMFDRCRRIPFRSDFTKELLNRPYILAALGLHSLGIKNYCSEFRLAVTYQDYYSKCGGNIVLP